MSLCYGKHINKSPDNINIGTKIKQLYIILNK